MSAFKGWGSDPFWCLFGHKWVWRKKERAYWMWSPPDNPYWTVTVTCRRCDKTITTEPTPEPKQEKSDG